jgi:hypothetical protein
VATSCMVILVQWMAQKKSFLILREKGLELEIFWLWYLKNCNNSHLNQKSELIEREWTKYLYSTRWT